MRRPTLTFDAIFAALLATGVAACSRGERAAPEANQPASTAESRTPVASPPAPPPPAATAAPAPAPAIGAADAGAADHRKGGGVKHACGAGNCSAEGKKGGK
jgi:hypothetical protein